MEKIKNKIDLIVMFSLAFILVVLLLIPTTVTMEAKAYNKCSSPPCYCYCSWECTCTASAGTCKCVCGPDFVHECPGNEGGNPDDPKDPYWN